MFSQDSFVEYVKHVCWSDVDEEVNPGAALEVYVELFTPVVDKHTPVKKLTVRTVKSPLDRLRIKKLYGSKK